MRSRAFVLMLATGIAVGLIGGSGLTAQPEPVKRTVLLKTDLAGLQGKEALVLLVELAPGAAAGKHHHPGGHEFGYVLEGSVTLEIEGKPPFTLKPGETAYVAPRQVHDLRNASDRAPVRAVVFSIVEKGQPATVPVK